MQVYRSKDQYHPNSQAAYNQLRIPGTPTVMVACHQLYAHIAAENHNASRFKLDNLPRRMLLANGRQSTQDMKQIQDWFVGAMNNDPMYSNQWRIPLIPVPGENGKLEWVNSQKNNRDMEFSQLYEIGMSIQQLGRFREAGSRSLTAILTFIEAHLNQILREIAPEYLFAFTGKDIKNNEQQNSDEKHRLATTTSVNSLRREKDEDEIGPGPIWNYPNTPDSRAAIEPLSKILPLNTLAESFGHEGYDADWARDIPAAWAQSAWQQEQQSEGALPEQTEEQDLEDFPDISELEKSLRNSQWPYRQLQITAEQWEARQTALSNIIMRMPWACLLSKRSNSRSHWYGRAGLCSTQKQGSQSSEKNWTSCWMQ